MSGVTVGALSFRDEFNGTELDTSRWVAPEGWTMNGVTTRTANATVAGGCLVLTLSSATEGVCVDSYQGDGAGVNGYVLPVGGYAEARVYFPGEAGEPIYNWPSWWASGPGWPAAGENDIAEGLSGELTVNYHGTTNSANYGVIPGTWYNDFHIYGLHRKASTADVYYDGALVMSYPTGDNGGGQALLLNVGVEGGRTPVTGAAGQVRIDYVRAWG